MMLMLCRNSRLGCTAGTQMARMIRVCLLCRDSKVRGSAVSLLLLKMPHAPKPNLDYGIAGIWTPKSLDYWTSADRKFGRFLDNFSQTVLQNHPQSVKSLVGHQAGYGTTAHQFMRCLFSSYRAQNYALEWFWNHFQRLRVLLFDAQWNFTSILISGFFPTFSKKQFLR